MVHLPLSPLHLRIQSVEGTGNVHLFDVWMVYATQENVFVDHRMTIIVMIVSTAQSISVRVRDRAPIALVGVILLPIGARNRSAMKMQTDVVIDPNVLDRIALIGVALPASK